MGTDLTLQAIPSDSKLFEIAAISPDHGESLAFLTRYFANFRSSSEDEIDRLFNSEAQRIKVNHPGIELRFCELHRSYDSLHFLLSENRRNGDFYTNDYGTQAILGENNVHKNAIATQGTPLRYVSASGAAAISAWLNTISVESLRCHYDPELMQAQAVYKFFIDGAGEEKFAWLCKMFEDLKNFYRTIEAHHEGALVVID